MAIAATPLTTATITAGGTTMCYSVPTTGYGRDLILTNQSTAASNATAFTIFVATGASSVSTGSGFPIPPGGYLLLGGQVQGALGSSNNQIYATCVSAATLVVGDASVVSVI